MELDILGRPRRPRTLSFVILHFVLSLPVPAPLRLVFRVLQLAAVSLINSPQPFPPRLVLLKCTKLTISSYPSRLSDLLLQSLVFQFRFVLLFWLSDTGVGKVQAERATWRKRICTFRQQRGKIQESLYLLAADQQRLMMAPRYDTQMFSVMNSNDHILLFDMGGKIYMWNKSSLSKLFS